MPPVSELHAQHDPLLVASLAADDLAGADRDRANAQIATCADCAELHADLILIARATAALPAVVAPRDFTLSPEQAAALRPVGWRRLAAAISGSRPLMSRQLGIGLATIGLAGLLVSTLPSIQFGGNRAGAPAGQGAPGAAAPAAGAATSGGGETSTDLGTGTEAPVVGISGDGGSAAPVSVGPVAAAASPAASALDANPIPDHSAAAGGIYGGVRGAASAPPTTQARNNYDANATTKAEGGTAPLDSRLAARDSDSGRGLVLTGSLVLLAAGIALLVIRSLARRAARG
jgi:hypothetical protein